MLNNTLSRLGGIGAIVLVAVLAVALVACGGSDNGSTVADTSADEAEHVEGDEATHDDEAAAEGDDGSVGMGDMDMGDDEAAHDEGDGDADATDYLEAAPKDALYLVEMTNFAFTPSVLEVNSDEVLEIAIQNVESVLHDFTIDVIDADVHISYLGGTGQHAHAEPEKDADVHFALTEPGSGVVHIKVHEPGEYVIYCTVPGHREAGMEGTLIVR